MARQCNDCENLADVDMIYLHPNDKNRHSYYPVCAACANKLYRKPRNKPRNVFYLQDTMAQAQVLRELLG